MSTTNREGSSIFHEAEKNTLEILLSSSKDDLKVLKDIMEIKNKSNHTPFSQIVSSQYKDRLQVLMEPFKNSPADLKSLLLRRNTEYTVMGHAALLGDIEVIQMLVTPFENSLEELEEMMSHIPDKSQETTFRQMLDDSSEPKVRELLKKLEEKQKSLEKKKKLFCNPKKKQGESSSNSSCNLI